MRSELLTRYQRLYSSLVSDCCEAFGLGACCARAGIQPYHEPSTRVAVGFAHTAQVHRTTERVEIDMLLRLVEETPDNGFIVIATDEDVEGALWGGLMTSGVLQHGAVGAAVDGGVRDLHQILPLGFPVWALYRSPLDIRGRAEMVAVATPVVFRGVEVTPGDLVFADANGVVCLPVDAAEGVLGLCEERLERELATARELTSGVPVAEVYARHGAI